MIRNFSILFIITCVPCCPFWFVQLPSAVRLEIYADSTLGVLSSTSDFLIMPLLQSPHHYYYYYSWLTYADTLPGFISLSCVSAFLFYYKQFMFSVFWPLHFLCYLINTHFTLKQLQIFHDVLLSNRIWFYFTEKLNLTCLSLLF